MNPYYLGGAILKFNKKRVIYVCGENLIVSKTDDKQPSIEAIRGPYPTYVKQAGSGKVRF